MILLDISKNKSVSEGAVTPLPYPCALVVQFSTINITSEELFFNKSGVSGFLNIRRLKMQNSFQISSLSALSFSLLIVCHFWT